MADCAGPERPYQALRLRRTACAAAGLDSGAPAERRASMPFNGAVDRLKWARPRTGSAGIVGAGRRGQLRHHFNLHVAVLQLPLVVLLEQHRADQADDRGFVGEDADDIGAAFDFFVEPLKWVGAVQFAAVRLGEIQIRQHIGLAVVDQRGKLRPFRPQLVGDVAQHLAGLGPVGLQESLAQRRRDHALLSFGDIGKSIAHPMHTGTVEKGLPLRPSDPIPCCGRFGGHEMLGKKERRQPELFIAGSLRDLLPDDHILVRVDRVLDLSWLRAEVAELYSADNGRPGIDPEVAVRLMLAGFLLGIVHDRRLMREAQVNLAIRWFIGYALDEPLPDHSSLTRIRQRWGAERFRYIFEQTVKACIAATGEVVHVDASLIRANVSWESLAVRHVEAVSKANEPAPAENETKM